MMNPGNMESCHELLKKLNILPLHSQYILSLLLCVVKNVNMFKVFNCLPTRIKGLSGDASKFKSALKGFILEGSFYTIQEYFDWEFINK
jgi:hypothetical protein